MERAPQSVAKTVEFRAFLALDGKTLATGKTIAIQIGKNGGAFGNPAAGATNATEISNGWYKFALGTGDTDTVGPFKWRGSEATIDEASGQFSVTAPDSVAVASIAAGAITAAAIADGAIDAATFAANAITATVLADNAITAAKIADGAIDEATYATTAGGFAPLGIIDQGTAQSASSTGLVLRSAAAFADNVLIGATLMVYGSTQAYWQQRIITANALSGDAITVDAWTVTPSGTITYKIIATPPSTAGVVLTQADVRAAMGLSSANLDDQLGVIDANVDAIGPDIADVQTAADQAIADIADVQTTVDAILTDTAEIGAAGAGLTNINLPDQTMNIVGNITGNVSGSVGSVAGAVGSVTGAVGSVTGNVGGSVASVVGAVGSVTGNVGGNVTGSVGSIAAGGIANASFAADAITASKVHADVTTELQAGLATATALAAVLAMLDDPRGEPGQGAPAVNPDAMTKLDYLYKAFRNKVTQTATELQIFADNGSTVDHKSTVSDDGTTFTRGEIATGA